MNIVDITGKAYTIGCTVNYYGRGKQVKTGVVCKMTVTQFGKSITINQPAVTRFGNHAYHKRITLGAPEKHTIVA